MGFHEASFGIAVSDHEHEPVLRLLYKEVIRYDREGVELEDRTVFTDLTFVPDDNPEHSDREWYYPGKYSKVIMVPYTDYHQDDGTLPPLEVTNEDELYEAASPVDAWWDHDIRLISVYSCKYVLGFGSVGNDDDGIYHTPVSPQRMIELLKLHDRLLAEGRIPGGYAMVGNCCS